MHHHRHGDAAPKQVAAREIVIGSSVRAESGSKAFCDAPELRPHAGSPWLLAHLKEWHGIDLADPRPGTGKGGTVSIPESLLSRHAVICGASGSGKTRLALHLLTEQLRAGASAVVIDFKEETVRQALHCAEIAGLSKDRITVVWPQENRHGIPGWNPFGGRFTVIRQAVREFVAIIEATTTSWGPRLQDVLTNAATIVAGQSLSLLELTRFLQSEEYREGLLRSAQSTPACAEFREEHRYFLSEFAALSRVEKAQAVAPVLNKIRTLVSMKYLRGMLCATRDDVNLPSLWQRQRLVAVHLDTFELGQDGTRLLSGMLCHSLFHTAMRSKGLVPVVLCLDEMGMQERFVGRAIEDILAMARSQNLRMLAACQHLGQLSESLKSALLTNTAFRAFFRLGHDDARRVAQSLGSSGGSESVSVSLGITRRGKNEPPDETSVTHAVVDMYDRPLQLSKAAWTAFSGQGTDALAVGKPRATQVAAFLRLCAVSHIPRVYVRVPGRKEVSELSCYVAGVPRGTYYISGPAPVKLIICFPRPKVARLQQDGNEGESRDMPFLLQKLAVREAIVRTDTGTPVRVTVTDIAFPGRLPDAKQYLHTGQSEQEIRACEEQRIRQIEALSRIAEPAPQLAETQKRRKLGPPGAKAGRPRDEARLNGRNGQNQEVAVTPSRALPTEPEIADDGSL